VRPEGCGSTSTASGRLTENSPDDDKSEVNEAVGASWSVAMQPDSMAAASDAIAR
jgi:hypothetical protein